MSQTALDQTVYVYGHSDDLIEITGVVEAEFTAYYDAPTHLAFSNGVVLTVEYDGEWTIRKRSVPSDVEVEVAAPGNGEHARDYSAEAKLRDTQVDWVVPSENFHQF